MPDLAAAQQTLRSTFGFEDFRPGQGAIIETVLKGADVASHNPLMGATTPSSSRDAGPLQLFDSENSVGTRSLPQIFRPARRGCSWK